MELGRLFKTLLVLGLAAAGVAFLYSQFGNFIPEDAGMPGFLGAALLYGLVLLLAYFITITLVWLLRLIVDAMWGDRGW
jgi:CBS domain containing-hemolysin-like protein